MILGLSHIAFSSDNIEAAEERLRYFGYTQRFDEAALKNDIAKAPLLSRHQHLHHIRALEADGAMAIELLDHGGLIGPQTSAMIPIFRSNAPCPDWQWCCLESLPISPDGMTSLCNALGQYPMAFYDPALSMTILWIEVADEPAGLYACVVPTGSLESVKTLLNRLRFRADSTGIWTLLTPIPSLLARLVPVDFVPAQGWVAEPFLDAPGCGCLALMARENERVKIPFSLLIDAVSFNLTVNRRNSRIKLVRPINGPIIELIEQTT